MSAQQRIQHALDAIETVRRTLRRLTPGAADEAELKRALRGLAEAEQELLLAMRDTRG